MTNAFLTGSQVYGTPNEASDVDLVVCASEGALEWLIDLAGEHIEPEEYNDGSISIRCGKLNLIVLSDPAEYERWRLATHLLLGVKPVSKLDAKRFFKGFVDDCNDQQPLPNTVADGIKVEF